MHKQNSTALCYCDGPSLRRKRGFGILEVLVAALVLGILYAAVSNLQKGNRDALLRIRSRDGATEVAQNIIDSLGALGLASFTDDMLTDDHKLTKLNDEGTARIPADIKVTRTWQAQPGIVQNSMSVTYSVDVTVSPDDSYKASATSLLLQTGTGGSNSVSHVYAKRLDVTVSWPFKGSTQSISVSGVIR